MRAWKKAVKPITVLLLKAMALQKGTERRLKAKALITNKLFRRPSEPPFSLRPSQFPIF
jgi:hypothetical protein